MQWYYEINDEQNGPVDEAELKQLVAEGTLSSENLVWKNGMDDWEPIGNAMPHLFSSVREMGSPGVGGAKSTAPVDSGGFHREGLPVADGFPSAAELRARAREGLSGNWGTAVLAFFVFGLIQMVLNAIPVIGSLVSTVIMGPLTLGLAFFFLTVIRRQDPSVGNLFNGFNQVGTAFGLFVLTNLIIFAAVLVSLIPFFGILFMVGGDEPETAIGGLVFMLVIVPSILVGIYLQCRFALIYYIANDEPELGVLGSIKMSGELMDGLKIKFVLLILSFIGWHILGFLALGLGLLVSIPYMLAAIASFYEAASGSRGNA